MANRSTRPQPDGCASRRKRWWKKAKRDEGVRRLEAEAGYYNQMASEKRAVPSRPLLIYRKAGGAWTRGPMDRRRTKGRAAPYRSIEVLWQVRWPYRCQYGDCREASTLRLQPRR